MLAAMGCNSPFPELNVVEATVTDDLSLLLLLPVFRVLDVIIFPVELDMAPPTPGDSVNFLPTNSLTFSQNASLPPGTRLAKVLAIAVGVF